jgi:hypothetical protein
MIIRHGTESVVSQQSGQTLDRQSRFHHQCCLMNWRMIFQHKKCAHDLRISK